MTDAHNGVAVWPSGSGWLLLSTRDGFQHVTNRTPQGVDTDGGLVAAAGVDNTVVAVGAHDRLLRSPVLIAAHGWHWSPGELPGAVAASRAAVSASPTTAVVTADSGTLERSTARGWRPVVVATSLGRTLTLDAVTWADSRIGWLTGSADRTATAYTTRDGGLTWKPVAQSAAGAGAALPPCGSGSSWVLPVVRDRTSVVMLHTTDTGAHWAAGSPVKVGSEAPVVGCARDAVWLDARSAGDDRILSSSDGGAHWTDRGSAPAELSDLTPTGGGTGFATSRGSHPALWRVTGDGTRFLRLPLPGWVSELGKQDGDGS